MVDTNDYLRLSGGKRVVDAAPVDGPVGADLGHQIPGVSSQPVRGPGASHP
ncbi:hypothetical protein ACLF6K_00245 [Streptomyces xanthophaeus]|uniref:hypothetical protein n=1 Tax=Streptomyces xanthophaeus TaxID=67385 RepID=UPI00398FC4B2